MGDTLRTSPPPSGIDLEWVAKRTETAHGLAKEAHGIAKEARDAALRIERAIGESPDPVRGVNGSGLSLQLAALLERRQAEERENAIITRESAARAGTLRAVLATIVALLGAASALVAILKAVGVIH